MSKKQESASALKAGMWYVICNFLLKGINFFTTPVFARMLTTDDYGITATYTSYLGIFTVLATLDLYSCVQISKQDYKEDNDRFVSSVLFLSSTLVLAFYGIIKIVSLFVNGLFDMPGVLIDIMFLNIFFTNAFTLMQTQDSAFFRYKKVSFFTILSTVSSVFLGIGLVSWMNEDKYMGKIMGTFIPMVIISIYAMIHIYTKGKCLYEKRYWTYALKVSVPLIPHHLSGDILANFDRIIIKPYQGSTSVAIYSLTYNCALVMQIIWSSLNGAWVPWFFDVMTEEKYDDIKKYVKPYTLLFAMMSIGMVGIGPELMMVLGPKEYWDGKWIIPPIVYGVFFQFIYSLYVNIEFYYKKTSKIATMTIVSAVVNIVLNFIFIPIYGYIAAAFTTLIGYVLLFILHYIIAGRICKRDLYNKKFVWGSVIGTGLLIGLLCLLYEQIVLRYIIVAGLCILFVIVNWPYAKEVINRRKQK